MAKTKRAARGPIASGSPTDVVQGRCPRMLVSQLCVAAFRRVCLYQQVFLGGGRAGPMKIVPPSLLLPLAAQPAWSYGRDLSLVALRPRFSPGLPWLKGVFSARRLGEDVKAEKNTEFEKKSYKSCGPMLTPGKWKNVGSPFQGSRSQNSVRTHRTIRRVARSKIRRSPQ